MSDKDQRLQEVGKSAADSIRADVAALEFDYERFEELKEFLAGEGLMDIEAREELHELIVARAEFDSDITDRDSADQRVRESALSLEVRSGWTSPGEPMEPEEFCLLLGTGGPAVCIIGEIRSGAPYRPRLQVQDWGTPWTDYDDIDESTLQTFCECFYFGE